MRLGVSKRIITPSSPVRLAGYADRPPFSEGVDEDIYVRVHAYEHGGESVILVYADILWFSPEAIPMLHKALEARGIDAGSAVFIASHNHSGPGTGNTFTALLEIADESWRSFFVETVAEAAAAAVADYEEVELFRGEDSLDLNVYRRKSVDGRIQMMPDYSVSPDRRFTVIAAKRPDGRIKGLLLHYACHANLTKANRISGDYPGHLLSLIDEKYEDSVSIFLQGCTADLRPNAVLGNAFCPVGREGVERFASMIFSRTVSIVSRLERLEPAVSSPSRSTVDLPLCQDGVRERASSPADEAGRQWAAIIKAKDFRSSELLRISFARIGIPMVFFSAEMAQDYAGFIRTLSPSCLSIAYADGMTGYVSTAKEIAEGGYEPDGSAIYFALAGTFSPEIEELIEKEAGKLLKGGMQDE